MKKTKRNENININCLYIERMYKKKLLDKKGVFIIGQSDFTTY